MNARALALRTLTLSAASAPVLAQTPILRLPNPATDPDNTFAISMCGISDVDGDGIREIVVGNPGESALEVYAGAVRVYSGWDGEELHLIRGTRSLELLGRAVCELGDIDGDGRGDFAAAWREAGQRAGFRAYSGYTGAVLYELSTDDAQQDFFGLAGLGDIDGDGYADVGVPCAQVPLPQPPPAPQLVRTGAAWIYSGRDGALLHQVQGTLVPLFLDRATRISAAGDLDADGRADYVVAGASPVSWGLVRAFSGRDHRLLLALPGDAHQESLYWPAGAAGDWNGDGRGDLFVTRLSLPGFTGEPRIEIRSGSGGGLLDTIEPSGPWEAIADCLAVGDTDGDGRGDLAVLFWKPQQQMFVQVFGGGSGEPLYPFDRELSSFGTWMSAAGMGDLTGDGLADVGFSRHGEVAGFFSPIALPIGAAQCFGGAPGSLCPCGNDAWPGAQSGCVNSTGAGATLSGYGIHLHLNPELELVVDGAPADSAVAILRSTGLGSGTPFPTDGAPCLFQPAVVAFGTTGVSGSLHLTLDPGLPGDQSAYFQAWYRDEQGSPCNTGNNYTQALRVVAD